METGSERPTCVSMIVCDAIYRDEGTKKLILVGTFNRIGAARLPVTHPKMCVLFTLTDGRGTIDLSLTIEHEASGSPVVEMRGPLKIGDPLNIQDFHLEFTNLRFAAEGKYWIVLKAGPEIICQRPFTVERIATKGAAEQGNG